MNRKLLTLTLSLLLGLAAVVAVALGIATPQRMAQAQSTLLLEENFDYGNTPGTLVAVSSGNWISHSGTSGPVMYITASLSMPKYGSSGIGGAAAISTTGVEDVNRSFAAQTSGTIYYAALVRVITATSTGDYFLHLITGTTTFRARIFVRDVTGTLQFGLGTDSATGTYSSAAFSYNTTYLVVARYDVTGGSTALYVLDAAVPVEPSVPLLTGTGSGSAVRGIAIRQGTAGQRPAVIIDGIRVATTWEDAIGYTGEVSITKNVTPDTDVPYHGTVTYTIVLSNGRAVNDTVLFTDTLPAEVDFGAWIEGPDGATVDNDVITWAGTITAGTAITFSFTAQHVGGYGDVVTNTAEFSGTYDAGTAQAVFTVEKLTTDVTFIYHDLEDAVLSGEMVCLRGEFNGWACEAMNADPDNTVFSLTVSGLEVGQSYQYKYYVDSSGLGENSRQDMLNTADRVLTVTSGTGTVHDYRNVVVGWANLQWPPTLQTDINQPTDPVYGRVYIQNVTNPTGEGRGIKAEVGYGTGDDPAAWTWFPMTWNAQYENNDEFAGVMAPTAAGVFSYAVRFDGNWGPGNPNAGWTYADRDGSPPFSLDQTGVLTVVLYDVAVSKAAPTEPVVVRDGEGALVTYTLTIENRSTITPVAPITLTDVLPEGFVYVSDDSGVAPSGSGTADDPLVWVFTDTLAPGASFSFNLVVSATDALTATGRYTNTAQVAVEGGDWIPENDTAQAGVMVYRIVPIAVARAGAVSETFAIEGTVIYTPGTYNALEWGIQDESGGIAVYYSPAPAISYGDRVRLVATRGVFRNQEQMNAPVYHFSILGSGPEVAPKPYATGVISTGTTEGWLVQVEGYVSGLGTCAGNYSFLVNDGSGPAYIWVDSDTGVDVCTMGITNTDYVRVVGFSTQFDNLYEIKPRRPADVKELYPTTFVYHDLEDVVRSGEAVYLAGSFNGWSTTATPMNASADFSVFSVTVVLENPGTYEYKYVVYTDTVSGPANWNWLQSADRSVTVNAPTTVDDYRNIQPGYVVLQRPHATTTTVGVATENIYGQIRADDLTARPGEPRAILAQVGYGTDPDPANWTTWSPMTWNTQSGDNDEFMGVLTPTAGGVYSYVVRFNGNWGAGNPNSQWYYGDTDGVSPSEPFEIENAGVLTVLAPGLSVSKSVAPTADVPLGGVVTCTVVLSNSGAGDALGVVLTDALPAEVTFGGWVQQNDAIHESGVITWTGDVAGGAEVTLVFTATLNEDYSLYGKTVTNTARFVSENAGSGEASAAFTVIGAPSLTVSKSVAPTADVPLGGVVTYTIVLSNSGAGDALGVVLTDALPAEVTFGGWVQQSNAAIYESGVITWTGTVTGRLEVTAGLHGHAGHRRRPLQPHRCQHRALRLRQRRERVRHGDLRHRAAVLGLPAAGDEEPVGLTPPPTPSLKFGLFGAWRGNSQNPPLTRQKEQKKAFFIAAASPPQ